MKILRYIAITGSVLCIGALFGLYWGIIPGAERTRSGGIAAIGGPFTLSDQNKSIRSEADFRGKFLLIYFGYSYCPDVCPTALQVISVALEGLPKRTKFIQPIFISVDPERDTADHLKEYLTNFHPSFIGLTGTKEQIKNAARAFRVYYNKSGTDNNSRSKDYLMDHSSIIFLMDPDGRYVTHFTHKTTPSQMSKELRTLVNPK